MSLYQDQQFHWLEPFQYAWLCGRTSTREVLLVAGLLWAILILLVLAFTTYSSLVDIQIDVSLAFIIAFFCFTTTWLVSRMPRNVLVYKQGICVGKTIIPVNRISSAGVEPVVIKGKSYAILQFCTANGRTFRIGLSKSVDAAALAKFLQTSGIGLSQANQS